MSRVGDGKHISSDRNFSKPKRSVPTSFLILIRFKEVHLCFNQWRVGFMLIDSTFYITRAGKDSLPNASFEAWGLVFFSIVRFGKNRERYREHYKQN